jgi:hypothetical protein
MGGERMDEAEMLHIIGMLVNERHELLQKAQRFELEDGQGARIKDINTELDRVWDMVRRYRARRENGLKPDNAKAA